jgi:predicted dehydrogenase
MTMKTIRFGIIGGGLMGRELAVAAARWAQLVDPPARPEVVALGSGSERSFGWFKANFPSITQYTTDYRQVLANGEVDVVYVAVPHHLHAEVYCAAIEAGKHLLGEKPFGIDLPACEAIVACAKRHPEVFVRCSSEFPFFPAAQKIAAMIEAGAFGRLLEVHSGLLHSSDLDPNKPINWKRQNRTNGEYGCMGDLGMHVCHVPFRAGWVPADVRAVLSKIITQRPDGKGGMALCDTWDNATLLCRTRGAGGAGGAGGTGSGGGAGGGGGADETFPWTMRIERMAPGERNTWYLEVYGTRASARWSTRNPKVMETLQYAPGGEQNWVQVQTPYDPPFKTITGPNFEFGFGDCFLQMWAAFLYELVNGKPIGPFAGCVMPEEVLLSHRLFTAALRSQAQGSVATV